MSYLVAIQGAALLTLDDRLRWAMQLDEAVTAISQARADVGHWTAIFDAVNLVEQLVLDGFARDDDGIIEAAQQACVDIADRRTRLGVRSARSHELAALRNVVSSWSDMMEGLTHQQRAVAEERLRRRIDRALRTPDASTRTIRPSEVQA